MTSSSDNRGFSPEEYWKSIILYGLNAATYKMALGKCLLEFAQNEKATVQWDELSLAFFLKYKQRLQAHPMPQQSNPNRLTTLERIVRQVELGTLTDDQAVGKIAKEGFQDVVPRFQTIGTNAELQLGFSMILISGNH